MVATVTANSTGRTYLPRMAHTVLSGRNDLYRYGDSLEIVTPPAIRDFLGIGIRREIPIVSKQELARIEAVATIEKWWGVVKDKRVFHLLKQAICASEYSLTREIIRKVSPIEAELLTDPAIQAKIKFRFGGEKFPPIILFKIFTSMSVSEQAKSRGRVHYMSGKRMIRASSEAAMDAKRQMGDRKFQQQVMSDMNQHVHHGATDEVDITTTKDYMQYMSNVDESPAYLGGKDNTWRRLDLTSLPRHTPLHNLVDLLDVSRHAGNVSLHQLSSCTRLLTQQPRPHPRAISVPHDRDFSPQPPSSESQRSQVRNPTSDSTQRRSRQAKKRAELMRKTYSRTQSREGEEQDNREGEGQEREVEAWQEEAEDLYQWTQNLSFDDIR